MALNDSLDMATIDVLETEHQKAFVQALMRVLETDVAERTFAEIIDGLPTIESYQDFHWPQEGHPATQHLELCPGMIEKARQLRSDLPVTSLTFRLPQDGANHTHQDYQKWIDSPHDTRKWDGYRHPTAFCHRFYVAVGRYPNGDADTVGYWAEAKVFGGCNELYLHASRRVGPYTLFPLTTAQFERFVDFLLGDTEDSAASQSPLPFRATSENRWRWHSWDAITRYHIFRDKYERTVQPTKPTGGVKSSVDWPEIGDELYLIGAMHDYWDGQPVDKDKVREALENLQQVTPSSPVWSTRNAHTWTKNLFE
ncbi:hypothetical protein FNAPI_11720 [Fusarium napiforme]|uniref:Uncharacterized protein n=1 Tax=Fusarium napiforme TaxID=42672 RepID=A0A8H5IIL1_9HYPO|nr:hypothetical protein FNAPI_11720 [Fusarium napiforme]